MAEEHHHTISGLVGKLITESEVNCEAHKYYEIFKHHEDVPNAVPHQYTAVKVIEGHGITSGCIKEWDYIHEGKTLVVKETTTYDDEAMTIHHSAVGGDVLNDYKKFDATLAVKPKANGKGCIASWTIDYVKLNEDSPVPISYLAFFQQNIEDLNTHLCEAEQVN
ncbi:major latex protein 15-like [Papaver somniferum]|uniref:major latex protein 15-like n=1 Tax=Papaver somniferum TaxID=3469 RepID=UPI000E6F8AA0|nr:major latex protein 15-like [Papaver somniferum]